MKKLFFIIVLLATGCTTKKPNYPQGYNWYYKYARTKKGWERVSKDTFVVPVKFYNLSGDYYFDSSGKHYGVPDTIFLKDYGKRIKVIK